MIGAVIKTLIGGAGDVYPGRATQTAKAPFMVYHILAVDPADTKQAPSTVDTYRIQLNIYGEVLSDCDDLNAAIRAILDGYSGTVGAVKVDSARYIGEVDLFDDQAQYYCRSVDYKIRIRR